MVHGLVVHVLLVQFLMVLVLLICVLLIQNASGLGSTGFRCSHTLDGINRDTVDTPTETKEAECSQDVEGEMLIDEDSFKDNKQRKVSSLLVK